jgi:ATP-binding cassette subfamily F protein uup
MAQNAPAPTVLSILNVEKSFGAQNILDGISLTIHEGDRIGLIGRNGCGKSTLLKIISGLDTPEKGNVSFRQGLRVAMLSQDCKLNPEDTVGSVIELAAESVRQLLERHHQVAMQLGEVPPGPAHDRLAEEFTALQHELELTDAWHIEQTAKRLAAALGLPAPDRTIGSLSGGELRRTDLAATLLKHPDVLLLDEPTNHIDVASVQWIETFLETYAGSCILVTHDRYFLDRVANRIVEIERGRMLTFPGNYTRFLELKSLQEETEARSSANRKSFLRRELEWIRRGPKARTTKDKSRIMRFEETQEAHNNQPITKEISFQIPQAKRLGKVILEAQKIAYKAGDRFLFRNFSLLMQEDMRVGILGPNGCGKTTLLRVLMGLEEPERGRIIHGENMKFLYVDQGHEEVNPEQSVLQHVSNGAKEIEVNGRRIHVPAWLDNFLFDRTAVNMAIGRLSGGERNRIDLARKLLLGGNFLVLDEPTNDLDLPTLRILEEAILGFDGCAFVVSHDRYFLNRVCNHLLIFEGDSIVKITGNYDDYLLYVERSASGEAEPSGPTRPQVISSTKESNKRGLHYNERKELKSIETAIEKAERAVVTLEERISHPETYKGDYKAAHELAAQLSEAKRNVESLYARWAELEAIANATT